MFSFFLNTAPALLSIAACDYVPAPGVFLELGSSADSSRVPTLPLARVVGSDVCLWWSEDGAVRPDKSLSQKTFTF